MSDNTPNFDARDNSLGIDGSFIDRWSPRAFQAHSIDEACLARIIEAGRWSPSCFNAQPWRFFTSTDETFDAFFNLLVEGNQSWAKNVSTIGFLVAQLNFEHNGKENSFAQFDCGAAWMSMSLQARKEGLYSHGMGGIKADEAAQYLQLNADESQVVMGFTIGKLADLSRLDEQQKSAETPNGRKSLQEIWTQV
jgi:nitroreductase